MVVKCDPIFFKDTALTLIKPLGLRLSFSFDHCHPRVAAEPYCFSGQYCEAILDIRPYTSNVMKTETVKRVIEQQRVTEQGPASNVTHCLQQWE